MSCIFCDIIAGKAPAQIVFQDGTLTAFRDLHPRAPTHILIVPNEHIESLAQLTDAKHVAAAGACLRQANLLAQSERLTGGYRVVANVGADSGQSVLHLHFHLLGGRRMGWPPG